MNPKFQIGDRVYFRNRFLNIVEFHDAGTIIDIIDNQHYVKWDKYDLNKSGNFFYIKSSLVLIANPNEIMKELV